MNKHRRRKAKARRKHRDAVITPDWVMRDLLQHRLRFSTDAFALMMATLTSTTWTVVGTGVVLPALNSLNHR